MSDVGGAWGVVAMAITPGLWVLLRLVFKAYITYVVLGTVAVIAWRVIYWWFYED